MVELPSTFFGIFPELTFSSGRFSRSVVGPFHKVMFQPIGVKSAYQLKFKDVRNSHDSSQVGPLLLLPPPSPFLLLTWNRFSFFCKQRWTVYSLPRHCSSIPRAHISTWDVMEIFLYDSIFEGGISYYTLSERKRSIELFFYPIFGWHSHSCSLPFSAAKRVWNFLFFERLLNYVNVR